MAPSSPRRNEPSSAVKRASTSLTALPGRNKKKTPPPPPLPEASDATQPPGKRKPALFQRTWSPGDEVRILETLATYRRGHGGSLPTPAELFGALDGSLEKKGVGAKELAIKQRSLKRRYDRDAKKTALPADEHERRLYLLSRHVWGRDPPPRPPVAEVRRATQGTGAGAQASKDAAQASSADHQSGKEALKPKAKTLDEMRELYPHLVDEASALVEPAVLEKVLPPIHDNEAQALDKKVKRARRQLTKAIRESARMKNMETSAVFLCQATRLQLEKSRVDEEDGLDICSQERLARVEREIVELRQILIDPHYHATIESNLLHDNSSLKGVRCKSEESHPQLAVAENQIPRNILQKKIEVPNGFPHEKNEEVTSKCKHDGVLPPRFPRDNLKLQGLIKPPFNTFHGRIRKIDAESQTAHYGWQEVVLLSIVWPHTPVGKAILQSSSLSTIVGGMTIGTECCKVFLSEGVKKRCSTVLAKSGDENV